MVKVVRVDGKDVVLKTNGAMLLRYKALFKKDLISELLSVAELLKGANLIGESVGNGNDNLAILEGVKGIDFDIFYNLFYVLAKNGNGSICDDMSEYFAGFEDFSILDYVDDIMSLVLRSFSSSVEVKKKLNV